MKFIEPILLNGERCFNENWLFVKKLCPARINRIYSGLFIFKNVESSELNKLLNLGL